MRLRLTLPICMLITGLLAFAVGPAATQANSALDQYVEEIPTTQGKPTEFEQPKGNSLKPEVKKQLDSHGQEGIELGQVAAATAPVTTAVPQRDAKERKRDGKQENKGESDRDAKADELEQMIEKGPGTSKALGAAADASGINGPLAAFVALVAIFMVGYSVRRRRTEG